MRLNHGIHLAYCTNIHRGGDWPETFRSLNAHTLKVRDKVCPDKAYAIGLRLGDKASRQLAKPDQLDAFRRWLDDQNCYVFTINGFPYGQFHGTRVKEQVYAPDWTTLERVEYTKRLFEILVRLLPEGVGGSVSTVPCSFKEFIQNERQEEAMRRNLWECIEHIALLSETTGADLHLGLEPEPLCHLETSAEMIRFQREMAAERPGDDRLRLHLGINYDTCHLAVEFEEAAEALSALAAAGIRVSKLHFSSAMTVKPTTETRKALEAFAHDIYFHQVIAKNSSNTITRHRDLPEALRASANGECEGDIEWRIHFHVPLHSQPTPLFDTTVDQLVSVMDVLSRNPAMCSHIEMETYTWEVLPPDLKKRDVVDQLVAEYDWTLGKLARRGIKPVD